MFPWSGITVEWCGGGRGGDTTLDCGVLASVLCVLQDRLPVRGARGRGGRHSRRDRRHEGGQGQVSLTWLDLLVE